MHKGGVGKTTLAVNLAVALAALGRRVLVLDLDAQGNATTLLGYNRAEIMRGSYDLLTGKAGLHQVAHPTKIPGISIAPASFDLLDIEVEMGDMASAQHRLIEALDDPSLAIDVVIADCPPAYGVLTLNALVAAGAVLMPIEAGSFALEGLEQILWTVGKVKESYNHRLRHGVVMNMADLGSSLAGRVEEIVRAQLGERVFQTIVPRDPAVAEAAFESKPVLLYNPQTPASAAYMRLAAELLWRNDRAARGDSIGGWVREDGDLLPDHPYADFEAVVADCLPTMIRALDDWRARRPGDPASAGPAPILGTLPEALLPSRPETEADRRPFRPTAGINVVLGITLGMATVLGLIGYLVYRGMP